MQLQSSTAYTQTFEAIDTKNGVLKGVLMVSEGEAKGHGVLLNKAFVQDVVRLGKAQERGVKSRFGHPNMCSTALGTYLGVYKNIRLRKEKKDKDTRYHAVGDLHLSESAKDTPNGNLYQYVLILATERPDMFGSSIAFEGDSYEKEEKDENGNSIIKRYATINKLFATDLVDDPAATDSLFNENDMSAQVTFFLDSNPQIFSLITKKPEIINEFLTKYEKYMNFNFGKKKTFNKIPTREGAEFLYEGEMKEGIQLLSVEGSGAGNYTTDDFTFEVDEDLKVVSFEKTQKHEGLTEEKVEAMFEAFGKELLASVEEVLTPIVEKQAAHDAKFEKLSKGSQAKPPVTSDVDNKEKGGLFENPFEKIKELRAKAQLEYNNKKFGRA